MARFRAERLRVLILLAALFAAPPARAEGPGTLVRGSVRVKERSLFSGLGDREDRSGVVVYLTGFAQPGDPAPATLGQRDERLEPKLLPIVAGQSVVFPNFDRLYHNVFSVSPVKKFDLGQYRSTDPPRSVVFESPGLVPVYCNIHPHMISYVVVLENPAYAVTGADGRFEIAGAPAGPVTINAWIPGATRVSQDVTLVEQGVSEVELELVASERVAPHQRKDGSELPEARHRTLPMRRLRFRTKIFLALGGIACVSLALVLVLLQELTVRRVRENAQERFERTLTAFRRLEALRARFLSDEIESLAGSNPQFRTILSTASLAQADLGFGGGGGQAGEALHDANLRLQSLAPSLAVFARSDVVLVANAEGELLYSQAEPGRFGDDLGALPLLRSIAATGEGEALLRAGERTASGALLAPERPGPALFLVRGRPILFDGELHGIVLVGQELGAEVLADLRAISGIDLALLSRGEVVATTLDEAARSALAERSAASDPANAVQEWALAGERFLVRRAPVIPGTAAGDAEFLLLSSLDVELAFLRRLSQLLLAVGGGILLAALATSFGLARGITRPVAALGRAARRVGAGELDTCVEITTGDELEELGGAFNEMVAGLRERDLIKRSFERYVSKAVADEVLRNPTLAKLGGSRREITAMFVDLGGFTGISEALSPEAVVAHLNEYFEAACGAILAQDGAVSEFQGDGIVAFWGAPLARPDDAARACLAALGCEQALTALRARWEARGLPRLRFRIGLHTGEMVVGEVGSAERGKYAVVGDAMNLASRIEGANKLFGSRILISQATRERAVDAVECRELDAIRVVGRQQPVRVYELLAPRGDLDPTRAGARESFAAGLAGYRARDWDAAQRGFAAAAAQDPGDAPARAFLERVAALRERPPAPDWDGVFELTAK